MKSIHLLLLALSTSLLAAGCTNERPAGEAEAAHEADASPGSDSVKAVARGTVVETMDSGGYTYVQVETGEEKVWAAAPKCAIEVGDEVVVPTGLPMRNYHSRTLDRDFDLVYFVNSLQTPDGASLTNGKGHGSESEKELPVGHPPISGSSTAAEGEVPEVEIGEVEKADGGHTVGEIYADKSDLSGKEVVVRGKVTKFNSQIMGKNWLHVRDGSGDAEAGTNDLTVTTQAAAKVGDTVLVTGRLHLDKDFGYGYEYDVIMEDAEVTVE